MNYSFPLSPEERATLYYHLGQWGGRCGGEPFDPSFTQLAREEVVSIACEESRYDPRLLGILIDFLANQFRNLNPFTLTKSIHQIPTPQTLAVVSEFSKRVSKDQDLRDFFRIVLRGIQPVPSQMYWNTQMRPHLAALWREILITPREFKKWGFYAGLDPYLKESRPQKSPWSYAPEDRKNILASLLSQKPRNRMKDYLQALQGTITRQQAHADLRDMKALKKRGQKRARVYFSARPLGLAGS